MLSVANNSSLILFIFYFLFFSGQWDIYWWWSPDRTFQPLERERRRIFWCIRKLCWIYKRKPDQGFKIFCSNTFPDSFGFYFTQLRFCRMHGLIVLMCIKILLQAPLLHLKMKTRLMIFHLKILERSRGALLMPFSREKRWNSISVVYFTQ